MKFLAIGLQNHSVFFTNSGKMIYFCNLLYLFVWFLEYTWLLEFLLLCKALILADFSVSFHYNYLCIDRMVDHGRVKTFHISFHFPPFTYYIGVKIHYISSNYRLISHKKNLLLFIIDFLFSASIFQGPQNTICWL